MRYTSHCRAIDTPPRYQTERHSFTRETPALTPPTFAGEFHCTRNARKRSASPTLLRPSPAGAGPASAPPWSIAFAILLVANLATPACGRISRSPLRSDGCDDSRTPCFRWPTARAMPERHASEVKIAGAPVPDDVIVTPVERGSPIKTDYSVQEVVKAVSSAGAPFRSLSESVHNAYEVLSASTVSPNARESVRTSSDTLDFVTGLVPHVWLTRLPGYLASVIGDELEGKPFDPEKLSGILQFGDPRSVGSGAPVRTGVPARPRIPWFARPTGNSPQTRGVELPAVAPRAGSARPRASGAVRSYASEGIDTGEAVPSAARPAFGNAKGPVLTSGLHIVGEHEYLQGYAQTLTAEQLPAGEPSRVVMVDGQRYLKGEAGYYRAQRGLSADHWLVDAPKGGERRAQVPVTYDMSTGDWQAHPPLRLCGGGCGSSKPIYPPDSIAGSLSDISSAIRHVPNESAQGAIQNAFIELSEMHLRRANRPDLQSIRDNSIVNHRTLLSRAMSRRIDPRSPLIKQQREASAITAIYYEWKGSAEAFCQENAEILFNALLQNGVSKNQIRMITIKPRNRSPHVMVLYTESEHFIELLDRSTPLEPNPAHRDGISHELFREAIYLTRRSTVLLDPWSTTKAISFATATSHIDAERIINNALTDIGQVPGNKYVVSVTRPLGTQRVTPGEWVNSLNSDSASSQSATSPISQGGSMTSPDMPPSPPAHGALPD